MHLGSIKTICKTVEYWSRLKCPILDVYGLSRSLLATGTLITLLFSSNDTYFPQLFFYKMKRGVQMIPNFFYLFEHQNLLHAKIIATIIMLLVLIGYLPKLTCWLHWWVTYSFFTGSLLVDGGDQISVILTLFLIPICLISNKSNHWLKKINENINPYANLFLWSLLFVIQMQMSCLYLNAAVAKFNSVHWSEGGAVYYWFNHNIFGASNWLKVVLGFIFDNKYTCFAISWSVMIVEMLLFAAWFMNTKNKYLCFILGIIFHIVIIFVHGLASFFFAMAGGLVLYLLPFSQPLNK